MARKATEKRNAQTNHSDKTKKKRLSKRSLCSFAVISRVSFCWIFASWNSDLKAGKKLTKITDKCEETNQL